MSAESVNVGEVYERGVELRKRVVLLLGRSTTRQTELGGNTEISFSLGRGSYTDADGPRTLSLEVSGSTFSIKRSLASKDKDISKNPHGVFILKNMLPNKFSSEGNLRTVLQYTDDSLLNARVMRSDSFDQFALLRAMDDDLSIVEKILDERSS